MKNNSEPMWVSDVFKRKGKGGIFFFCGSRREFNDFLATLDFKLTTNTSLEGISLDIQSDAHFEQVLEILKKKGVLTERTVLPKDLQNIL